MVVSFRAGGNIETVGGSQYAGDIYIDLSTHWVRRATLDEFAITEIRVPGLGQSAGEKIHACTVHHLLTRLTSREEYEKWRATRVRYRDAACRGHLEVWRRALTALRTSGLHNGSFSFPAAFSAAAPSLYLARSFAGSDVHSMSTARPKCLSTICPIL